MNQHRGMLFDQSTPSIVTHESLLTILLKPGAAYHRPHDTVLSVVYNNVDCYIYTDLYHQCFRFFSVRSFLVLRSSSPMKRFPVTTSTASTFSSCPSVYVRDLWLQFRHERMAADSRHSSFAFFEALRCNMSFLLLQTTHIPPHHIPYTSCRNIHQTRISLSAR